MLRRSSMAALIVALVWSVPVLAQDKFFDSAGVQIRYIEKGLGQPVVLVHGFTNYIERSWVETGVFDHLARYYHVIALDLRGHGKSGKPHAAEKYGAELGRDIARLLDHLRIQRAHIVGYSAGVGTIAKLMTSNPERFITAVFGGAAGRRTWTEQNQRDAEAEASELEHGLPYRTLILRTSPTDEPPPSEEDIRQRSRDLVARNDPLAHAALARARGGEAISTAQLIAARVPTLAIVGEADNALAAVKSLKTDWPALEVIVIQGASHTGARGAQRRPEFVQAIQTFIAAHN